MELAASTRWHHARRLVRIETLPMLLLIGAQVGLYLWMARRGFEFTDEAFYLLNYLHWRELVGLVSFFGFYLEWPFRALGQSVTAMRCLSLVLLMACAGWFTHRAVRHAGSGPGEDRSLHGSAVAVGAVASLFYFTYLSTLRAPSYNLLVLGSMLISTGLLLRSLEAPDLRGRRTAVLLYGVFLGMCGLSKATSGILLAACHAAFFVAVNPQWRWRPTLERLALTLLGIGLNVAVLSIVHPGWIESLRGGVSIFAYSGASQILEMVNGFRWDLQRLAPLLPAVALAGLVLAFVSRRVGRSRPRLTSLLVVALVGMAMAVLLAGQARLWWPALVSLTALLFLVELATRTSLRPTRSDRADAALLLLLLVLPLAYSFGTAMPVFEHSRGAAVLAVIAVVLRLVRLDSLGLLVRPATLLCLTSICVPTLWAQMQAAHDVGHTYRQASALAAQSLPVQVGRGRDALLVDAPTRQALDALTSAARAAGMRDDQPMLDFTGEGPGLVYALRARPLGVAWLVGGYPDSSTWAGRLLGRLAEDEVRQAWLLASTDNPRAILGWEGIVQGRVGPGSHELVATVRVRAPSHWKGRVSDTADLQLWRPASTRQASAVAVPLAPTAGMRAVSR